MSGHSGPAVVFDQVFKAFGPNQVQRDVSFSVPAGKALCILGRSGTGKSVETPHGVDQAGPGKHLGRRR
jgi:phospholipid/cholesterol/gamma-HCH transport system ATP-binding protein